MPIRNCWRTCRNPAPAAVVTQLGGWYPADPFPPQQFPPRFRFTHVAAPVRIAPGDAGAAALVPTHGH